MEFIKAVKAMKEGKDVKLSDSTSTLILHIDCDIIKDNTNVEYAVSHGQIMSSWEIVEEKKAWNNDSNLSSRIQYNDERLEVEDVKEAIKEFLERYKKEVLECLELEHTELFKMAKKIFGKKLC